MRRIVSTLLIGVMLAAMVGCGGDSTGPATLPRVGRYSYSLAVAPSINSTNTRTFTGTMIVTYVSRDSLGGRWEVTQSTYKSGATAGGYTGAMSLGFFNGGGWLITAKPVDGGNISHRIFPGATPRCDGWAVFVNDAGGLTSRFGECALTYLGP